MVVSAEGVAAAVEVTVVMDKEETVVLEGAVAAVDLAGLVDLVGSREGAAVEVILPREVSVGAVALEQASSLTQEM